MNGEVVISLASVSFTYRDAERPALSDVTLALRRGELAVLMGATGAGKSTLARCLNCSIPQFHPGTLVGTIALQGRPVRGATVSDLAGIVGLVSQDFEAQLFASNVRQEVAFGMEQLGLPRAEMQRRLAAALEVVGLVGFEARDPGTLSGGEKQRLAIAATLALRPPIIIFDEPTTDLDPLGKAEIFAVLESLRGEGSTILLIEHETEAAQRADRLLLMDGGRLVADGPPEQLLRDVDRLERLGVRPLDLDRIGTALAWEARVETIDDAVPRLTPSAEAAPAAEPAPPSAPVLELAGIDYTYANGQHALADVSLAIHAHDFVALIGQNGSGKTTLAKCLNGLVRPQRGVVRLHGDDLAAAPLNRIAAEVGYVFQNPDDEIFAASVREEVAFGLRNFAVPADAIDERVAGALAAVGLSGSEARDPFLLGKGQRQRLAVASFLALAPSVLILDEPTTGLDYPEQRRMMDLLAALHAKGMTLVVITHTPWVVAQYARRGVLMDGGRIAFDGPLRALFREESLLERCHFRVPDVTRLGNRLGVSALSVDELLAQVRPLG